MSIQDQALYWLYRSRSMRRKADLCPLRCTALGKTRPNASLGNNQLHNATAATGFTSLFLLVLRHLLRLGKKTTKVQIRWRFGFK
ncbi:hypothetical protein J6590_043273 [Homalodisca vitripennis]|nr:hypothetical protein J6590_043273 [Homalodisca vitripennis]